MLILQSFGSGAANKRSTEDWAEYVSRLMGVRMLISGCVYSKECQWRARGINLYRRVYNWWLLSNLESAGFYFFCSHHGIMLLQLEQIFTVIDELKYICRSVRPFDWLMVFKRSKKKISWYPIHLCCHIYITYKATIRETCETGGWSWPYTIKNISVVAVTYVFRASGSLPRANMRLPPQFWQRLRRGRSECRLMSLIFIRRVQRRERHLNNYAAKVLYGASMHLYIHAKCTFTLAVEYCLILL